MGRTRLVLAAWLVGLAGAGLARLVAPERSAAVWDALVRFASEVPTPVVAGLILLAGVVLWFVLLRYLLVLVYRAWRLIAGRVKWALGLAFPDSPLVQFAVGTMLLIGVVLGIVGVLPILIGDLSETDEGAAGYVNRFGDAALNSEWGAIVDGDAAGGEPGCDGAPAGGTDADGDGLPDDWERAGATPDGAALPGASPGRKDLYVQVNYGADIERLTAAERRQLRAVWARMPVPNPDGTRGIALHLDDESPRGGGLGETTNFTSAAGRTAYYTESRLGARRCVYHQVVFGKVEMGRLAGVASMPGYSAVVDGSRQPRYEGNVSFRVALATHELLHNVAGRVDGRPHTSAGWLRGGPDNEFLSEATAADLSETGLHGPAA